MERESPYVMSFVTLIVTITYQFLTRTIFKRVANRVLCLLFLLRTKGKFYN